MKQFNFYFLLIAMILIGSLGVAGIADAMPRKAEKNVKKGVVKAWRLGDSNYCHLKFPPIKVNTLLTGKPELADPEHARLIDYYGPCDHDPLGEVEVERQTNRLQDRLYKD